MGCGHRSEAAGNASAGQLSIINWQGREIHRPGPTGEITGAASGLRGSKHFPKVNGYVKQVWVDVGAHVKKARY